MISEIQVAGLDAGDEFIELYNPTETAFDLSSSSIQYVSGNATTTQNVLKKNFNSGNIPPRGFFLIARGLNASSTDGYVGPTPPDLTHRSFSLSAGPSGAKIFLVANQEPIESFDDPDIIDWLDYSFAVPPPGQSLERKAWRSGFCLSARDEGEFLGNGCDTDSDSDFEIRAIPKPQNSQNLPEPRPAPSAVTNFTLGYHQSVPALTMSWSPSQDAFGSTTTLTYQIEEINSSSSAPVNFITTSTQKELRLYEIGRSYEIAIKAIDAEGLASFPATSTIFIPSLITS